MRLTVKSPKFNFEGTFERKLNLIQGKSATGKTTLFQYCSGSSERIKVSAEHNGALLDVRTDITAVNYLQLLPQLRNSVVLIDEVEFVTDVSFLALLKQDKHNFYVIITRKNINLPYALAAVYEIVSKNNVWQTVPFLQIVAEPSESAASTYAAAICEDSGSGLDFYSSFIPRVVSAHGKDNIPNVLESLNARTACLFVDTDGFGYTALVLRALRGVAFDSLAIDSRMYCFEYVLLRSKMFADIDVDSLLRERVLGACNYEIISETLISDIIKGTSCRYSKETGGASCFLASCDTCERQGNGKVCNRGWGGDKHDILIGTPFEYITTIAERIG
jgi:hypothetical protein